MQLATENFDQEMMSMYVRLNNASGFLDSIDEKGSETSTRSFYFRLRMAKKDFPSLTKTSSKFSVKKFEKRNDKDRVQLKRSVKEDITPLLDIARDFLESPKLFRKESLPEDPDQCVLKLKEIKEQKEREIERLKSELDDISGAVHLAETLRNIKRSVALLDDARFADAALCAKKQRV